MLAKSLKVTFFSLLVIFNILWTIGLLWNEYDSLESLVLKIFYALSTLVIPIFVCVFPINALINYHIQRLRKKKVLLLHIIYFLGTALIIALCFTLFDYKNGERSTFCEIFTEYLPLVVIAMPVMIVNMIVFWKYFKKSTQ
jgi:hypothetical protein